MLLYWPARSLDTVPTAVFSSPRFEIPTRISGILIQFRFGFSNSLQKMPRQFLIRPLPLYSSLFKIHQLRPIKLFNSVLSERLTVAVNTL